MRISTDLNEKYESKTLIYGDLDDLSLLTLIADKRDKRALTEVYNRFKLSVGRYLQRGLDEQKLVDEAYNDVMLTVWNKADSFQGKSKVSTWIYGIANYKRISAYGSENKHAHYTTEDQLDGLSQPDNSSIEESVQDAIAKLSSDHRDVIELAYFHGYSTMEIAEIVNCPVNTVKTRLFHARRKLKTAFGSEFSHVGTE